MKMKDGILAAIAAAGSFVANQLGGWDTALAVLLCVMGLDYITGILLAAVWHKSPKTEGGGVSSEISYKGIIRKVLMLALVWMGALIDRALSTDYVRTAVIMFFIANDALSVIENTALMGVPYPKFIKTMLEAVKEKADSGTE